MNRAAKRDESRNPRVVFIAGMGRSGSTLLDRLLGAAGGVCAVGELRWIWTLGFRENQFCGCGDRFLSCPFWMAVVAKAFPDGIPGDPAAIAARQDGLLRLKWAPFVAARALPLADARRAFREFASTRRRLYRAIAAISGAHTIVDSSKYPPYGIALRALGDFDLRTVHLVRDSRATAHSVARQRDPSREGRARYQYSRGAGIVAVNWLALNALTEAAWASRRRYLRLRYEDLAADPARHTRRVLEFAGVDGATPAPGAGGAFDLGVQHTLAGNPMRMNHGPTIVQPDLEWRTALSRRDHLVITALTWPGLLRYGYR